MAEIENLKIGNGGTLHIVGNEDIVANAWQAGKTYVKNKSYVIREHRLYVCNVTHTSVEPFDATKWTEITIGDAIAANTTAIGDISTPRTITPVFNSQQSNYSIPYNNTSVVKVGKMVMCMVNPRCLSPYASYPGALVYSGLPKPIDGLNHFFTFNDWKGKQYEPIRFMLSASGELYLRNGQADSEYDGSIMYISE